MNRQLAAMPYLMCPIMVVWVVGPFIGIVGLSDRLSGLSECRTRSRTWTSVVPRNDCRKWLSDIVGLSDCRIVGLSDYRALSGIVGHCRVYDGLY